MRKTLSVLTACLLAAIPLKAQNVIDLIISEVMVDNTSSVVDDFGEHSPWVEIFNTSQGTVNFAGCYFSDDLDNLKKSPIIKGDNSTKLGPRQVALFFATGDSSQGTFYLNFPLRGGTTLYLVSNDGHTIVDSIDIPEEIPAGKSISKFAEDNKQMVFDNVRPADPTPRSVNGKHNQKSKAESIKETDPHGWTLTIVSVGVVFCALLILAFIYTFSGNCFSGKYKRKKKAPAIPAAAPDSEIAAAIAMALEASCGGETQAAIGLALHRYFSESAHDAEPFVITIKPRSSAWNDKTITFRKQPRKQS